MRYRPLQRLLKLALRAVLACAAAMPLEALSRAALEGEVEAARELAGRDPAAARERLEAIRRSAAAAGRLAVRLAADEAECRLLTDVDSSLAQRVAEAGLAEAARAPASTESRRAAQRLAACGAGALLDLGQLDRGGAQLEALISAAPEGAAAEPAVAMALLERGLHRSRRGELITGQADLLAACTALERLALRPDLELCQWHLANHYKRVGDTDEALRLLEQLLGAARKRGATADASIYVYGLAQVRAERREPTQALASFQEALALSEAMRDVIGIAYAEHGSNVN
jgi:tetratricopeptide (TPR) repeat protein